MQKIQAIEHFGGVTKVSALLGISRQAIHKWPPEVPDLYQYRLHQLSDGQLPLAKRLELPVAQ